MEEFRIYLTRRDNGADAVAIWHQAEADGVDYATRIRLVRELFDLSAVEAKEVSILARGTNLATAQQRLVDGLRKGLDNDIDEGPRG